MLNQKTLLIKDTDKFLVTLMFGLLKSNGIKLSSIQNYQCKINDEDNFSDFGFISLVKLKLIKVFDTN